MTVHRGWIGIGLIVFFSGSLLGILLSRLFHEEKSHSIHKRSSLPTYKKYGDAVFRKQLLNEVNPSNIRKYVKKLSKKPHLAGTPADLEQAKLLAKFWRRNGLKTKIIPYDVLLSYPDKENPNRIELQNGNGEILHTTQLTEEIVEPEYNHSDIVAPFNAFSPTGTPEGKLVYVNYGRFQDFQWITEEKKIDLSGHICIARYGKIFRGNKVLLAERFGCKAMILYSDPKDTNGGLVDRVYPEAQELPGDGVERGVINALPARRGDALTQGYPATETAYRQREGSVAVLKIPVNPIGYNDAREILKHMAGDEVPEGWAGALNITYRLGPGFMQDNWRIKMYVNNKNERRKIYNTFGILKGSSEPDRYVLIGNHRDAWVFGGLDPASGTGAMMETSRVLGKAYKQGWRPRRTIVFCSWSAEEYGLIGSHEFVEDYRHILTNRAVAYINVDIAVTGNFTFFGRSLPLGFNLLYEVAKVIPNPHDGGESSLYDIWKLTLPEIDAEGQLTGRPRLFTLGAGSDFGSFIEYIGVTCFDIMYFNDYRRQLTFYPLYHTAYDTFNYVDKFVDPGFIFHRTVVQFWIELARRLADDAVIPYKVTDYSNAIKLYVTQIQALEGGIIAANGLQPQLDFMQAAADTMHRAAAKFQQRLDTLWSRNAMVLRMMNDQMIQLEKAFIDPLGLPGRASSRHVVFAPNALDIYSGAQFPGIVDSLFNITKATGEEKIQRWENVKKQISVATYFIESAAALLYKYEDF